MTVLPWYRGKTNFFEKRVGDYQKSGVMAGLNNTNQHTIAFDEDFLTRSAVVRVLFC
jgi:hypothetical protein